MPRRLLGHVRQNAVAYLALFVALGGTSAYAANTVFSTDIVDGEVRSIDIRNDDIQSGDVKDNTINTFDVHSFLGVDVVDGTLTGADIQDGSIGAADLGGAAGATPFIGRGRASCSGGCTIFDFRPQGFTDNLEPGALENRAFRAPPGGLVVSDWAATLSVGVPAGHAFAMWLIEFSTSNVFISCTINGPASSCTGPGSATIPAGTLFWVVVNTSYSETRTPYLDFSFRARPAS